MPERRRRPGKPLDWDEDDIEKLARVSPEDAERAGLWWKKHAPPGAEELLDAGPDTDLEVEP